MFKKKCESKYYKIETPDGFLHIHINYEKHQDKPIIKSVFLRIPPLGTTISSLVALLGVIMSKYFELGGDPEKIIKHLNSVKSSKRIVIDENTFIDSIPQAIAIALKDFLSTHQGQN